MASTSGSSSRSDYGTITGQGTGFTSKARSEGDQVEESIRKSIEDAIQQIRKYTEDLRSIGLRIRSRIINKTDLHGSINTLTRNTRETVEECVSQLRTLRLRSKDDWLGNEATVNGTAAMDSTDSKFMLVSVSEIQQRVYGAISDFQMLSKEVMLTLRHSGKGKLGRKHHYKSFNDSGSEAGLSNSMGYEPQRHSLDSSGRMSSPEQPVFIVTSPTRQVNFEDMESNCRAIEALLTNMKMMSTEETRSVHMSVGTNGSAETPRSFQQQIQYSQAQNSIVYNQSQEQLQQISDSSKTKDCNCCCIS